jgi:O-antigen/teichoic acid export membrane protein
VLLKVPHLVYEFRLSCALILFNGLGATQLGALYGLERFRTAALVNLFRGLVGLPMLASGLWWGGMRGAIAAMTLTAFLTWVLAQGAVLKECSNQGIPISWQHARAELHTLWTFSLPAFIASALVGPTTWLGNTVLVNHVNGYTELGAFNAANQWRNAALLLPTILGQTVMPILASLLGQRDRAGARRVVLYSTGTSLGAAVPLAVVFVLWRKVIMGLYGVGFPPYASVLVLLAITLLLQTLQMPIGQVIVASGRMWLGAATNLAWSLAFLAAAWLLIGRGMGALGLALSYFLSYLIHSVWTGWFGARLLRGR